MSASPCFKGWRCTSYRGVVTAVVQDKTGLLLTRHSTCVRGLEQWSRSSCFCFRRTKRVLESQKLKLVCQVEKRKRKIKKSIVGIMRKYCPDQLEGQRWKLLVVG